MAYSKQTWTDDVSAVTGARMTHIEQGIYDNSLATDKINPSGTATTTAEIEEGQITDVIGFKSLKLKGQTSQGENPTPDSPQDVNNVSGDNVIGISNKNVLPNPIQSQTLNGITITRNSDGTLLINGTATANTYFDFSTNFDTTKYAGYKFYGFPNNLGFIVRISKSDRASLQDISSNGTVISNNGTGNYIAIRIGSGTNVNNRLLSPMIIAPTISDTSYAPHRENNFEVNLGVIELCKISTYEDYIYKKDGKWYLHKEIGSYTFTGNETFTSQSYGTNSWLVNSIINTISNDNLKLCISNIFTGISKDERNNEVSNSIYANTTTALYIRNTSFTSQSQIQSATNGNSVYYILATPIEEEITYAPLLRQLDELYNSGLYDVTNISQDNSSEAFILDMEACKNNINGIVEYIRR